MDPMELARAVCQPVENVVMEIVSRHMKRLAWEDIPYLTSAVWGSTMNGPLDATQTNIFQLADRVVTVALNQLNLPELTPAQAFTLNYMVRGLMIAKLCHARDIYHLAAYRQGSEEPKCELATLAPMGQA
jgi:hypothetical protein